MPSSHSAVTTAFATLVYMEQGVSLLFLLSFLVLILAVHDVFLLKRHTAEHAKVLNALSGRKEKKIEETIGHEPLEIGAGLVLGLVIALVVV